MTSRSGSPEGLEGPEAPEAPEWGFPFAHLTKAGEFSFLSASKDEIFAYRRLPRAQRPPLKAGMETVPDVPGA